MPGLILEGGTFRAIFSCGVMDALLDNDIMFPYCIGVSAGITDGISYVSRQRGRNLNIAMKYRNDKRYLGIRNYKTDKSIFGMNFIFGELANTLLPFDWETYEKYEGTFMVGVTNALTGEAEYKNGKDIDEKYTMLRASCAVPVISPEVMIDGVPYFDGGVADPIPIRKSIADGNEKNLIVLTRPSEYRKTFGRSSKMAIRFMQKKYPKMAQVLRKRHELYNETVRYCEQLEREGKAVLIRPEYPIESLEKDTTVLKKTYDSGYRMATERLGEIRALF